MRINWSSIEFRIIALYLAVAPIGLAWITLINGLHLTLMESISSIVFAVSCVYAAINLFMAKSKGYWLSLTVSAIGSIAIVIGETRYGVFHGNPSLSFSIWSYSLSDVLYGIELDWIFLATFMFLLFSGRSRFKLFQHNNGYQEN